MPSSGEWRPRLSSTWEIHPRAGRFLLPPPAFRECPHRGFPRRSVTVRWRAALMMWEYQCPHPRRSDGCRVGVEDAADSFTIGQHVKIVIIPFAGWARGRGAPENEIILLHRPNANRIGSPPRSRFLL
jgi:hypothetical protein